MNERCTFGIYYRSHGDTGRQKAMNDQRCPAEATAKSKLGAPRCEDHKAARWLVTVGFSLALTKQEWDTADDARQEVRNRLPDGLSVRVDTQRMTARRATVEDIERFEALAGQTLDSCSVSLPFDSSEPIPHPDSGYIDWE